MCAEMTSVNEKFSERAWLPYLVLVFAGAVAYWNSFWGVFVFDEPRNIFSVAALGWQSPGWYLAGIWEPGDRRCALFLMTLIYKTWGTNPVPYHALSLIIHILCGIQLFRVLYELFRNSTLSVSITENARGLSLVTSVLFLVHPLQTDTVTHFIQFMQALMGLFYLSALYCFIRAQSSKRPRYWITAALVLCAAGFDAKPHMLAFPMFVLLLDGILYSGKFNGALRKNAAFYIGTAMITLYQMYVLSHRIVGPGSDVGASQMTPNLELEERMTSMMYFLSQPRSIVHYLYLTFWPDQLCLNYAWPVARTLGEVVPYFVFVAVLFSVCILLLSRRSPLGLIGAWFFIGLSASSSVIPRPDVVVEHRMYLPIIAPLIAIVLTGHEILRRNSEPKFSRRWGIALVLTLTSALTVRTWVRNSDYYGLERMWRVTMNQAPWNAITYANVGKALADKGNFADAIRYNHKALEVRPRFALAHLNLGLCLSELGQTEEAIAHIEKAILSEPRNPRHSFLLARLYMNLKRPNEAAKYYEKAIALQPIAAARVEYAKCLTQAGRSEDAEKQLEIANRAVKASK